MKRHVTCMVFAVAAGLLLISIAAEAQWVMIGRKSMGVVQNMRSEHADVATVLLEAPADGVYSAALRTLNNKNKVKVRNADNAAKTIDFSRKDLEVKMKVSSVNDQLSMITVTSPGTLLRSGNASAVVDAILKVCKELKVECHEDKDRSK